MAASSNPRASGRVAFSHPNFLNFLVARWFIVVATEMQSVAVGWQVYEITKRALDLGLIGLAQFLPGCILFLASGHAADHFDRRKLTIACYSGYAVCSALLLGITLRGTPNVRLVYVVMVLLGVVRSFSGPVTRAILPQLIPEEHFPSAVAWNSSAFQSATILGPSIGGLVYALFRGPAAVYVIATATGTFAVVAMVRIKLRLKARPPQEMSMKTVLAGIQYIFQRKIVLGSISLDLFGVLLGGAVALLPVYARDILKTGPWGLGLSALLARHRRGRHGALSSPSPLEEARRRDDALVRGGIRCGDDSLRTLAQPHFVDGRSVLRGRNRHGQRHHSRNSGAARHAR